MQLNKQKILESSLSEKSNEIQEKIEEIFLKPILKNFNIPKTLVKG